MNVVFDTNIVIDVVAKRQPFFAVSAAVMKMAEQQAFSAAITASTITDIHYILRKYLPGRDAVTSAILSLASIVDILDVTRQRCLDAFKLSITDYEDALLIECARQWGAECIVTRNIQDFAGSPVKALTPDDFLAVYGKH